MIDTLRQAAAVMDNIAVVTTPVDTGYARSRWVVTIGSLPAQESGTEAGISIGEEASTAIALSQGLEVIQKWSGGESLFISNPVNYSIHLDAGSSEQAPDGMTDQAIAAGKEILNNARLLD